MAERLPEPIRIISDLHLGHPSCVIDDVGVLRPVLEGAGTVVFNGDTAELRASCYSSRAASDREKLMTLAREVGVEKCLFITGNHDPRISETYHVELCEGKLLVTHGDFLFRYVSPWSKELRHCRPRVDDVLAKSDRQRMASELEYRLQVTRACCDVFEVTLQHIARTPWGIVRLLTTEMLLRPLRLPTVFLVWMRSAGLMAAALEHYRPKARAAIFGHIHRPGVWRRRGRWVINTGGYLSMTPATVVEVRGHELMVREVDRRSGPWRLKEGKKLAL